MGTRGLRIATGVSVATTEFRRHLIRARHRLGRASERHPRRTNVRVPGSNVHPFQAGALRLITQAFVAGVFFGLANFLFGLEPIVEIRAWLIASLDVELIGSSPDSFFERTRRDLGFGCRCWCRHWCTSGDDGITDDVRSEGRSASDTSSVETSFE